MLQPREPVLRQASSLRQFPTAQRRPAIKGHQLPVEERNKLRSAVVPLEYESVAVQLSPLQTPGKLAQVSLSLRGNLAGQKCRHVFRSARSARPHLVRKL